MAIEISREEALLWDHISNKLRQASDALEEARLTLLLKLNIASGKPVERLDKVIEALNGLPYLFHPQTEWTGGDSGNPKNFKKTEPHIIRNEKIGRLPPALPAKQN